MREERQRILFVGPMIPWTMYLCLLVLVPTIFVAMEGVEEGVRGKLKVLSFGGNGNIGSAVLARMINTDMFDIVMTTRGGWHWDSDTRIGNIASGAMPSNFVNISCRSSCKNCEV